MRLTDKEKLAITDTATKVFGTCHVVLFGSRTDDTLKGGDIDLLIEPVSLDLGKWYELKITYLVELKQIIGEQKIDLIIKRAGDSRPITRTAQAEGIVLI